MSNATPAKTSFGLQMIDSASLEVFNELRKQDQVIILWQAENLALQRYQMDQEDPINTTGEWSCSTLDKEVTLCWRFEGVENGKPIFIIDNISTTAKKEEKTLSIFAKTKLGNILRILKNIKRVRFFKKECEEKKAVFTQVSEFDIRRDIRKNRELDNALEKISEIPHEDFLAKANASIQKLSNKSK